MVGKALKSLVTQARASEMTQYFLEIPYKRLSALSTFRWRVQIGIAIAIGLMARQHKPDRTLAQRFFDLLMVKNKKIAFGSGPKAIFHDADQYL